MTTIPAILQSVAPIFAAVTAILEAVAPVLQAVPPSTVEPAIAPILEPVTSVFPSIPLVLTSIAPIFQAVEISPDVRTLESRGRRAHHRQKPKRRDRNPSSFS